jgi:hypothetical protein
MKRLRFKVEWEAKHPDTGEIISGTDSEGSWFLLDQRGEFFSYGPLRPISKCGDKYISLIPKIKVGDEYLSIEEIEALIKER